MARCPRCASPNFRVNELGAIRHGYYCLNCNRSFDRLTPTTKLAGLSLLVGAAAEAWEFITDVFDDSGGGA